MRAVCDGFDVATPVGVLHFASEPSPAEVEAAVAALSAPSPEIEPTIVVVAEDGTVCDG